MVDPMHDGISHLKVEGSVPIRRVCNNNPNNEVTGGRGCSTSRASHGSRDRIAPYHPTGVRIGVGGGDGCLYQRQRGTKTWVEAGTRGRRCHLSAESKTKEIGSGEKRTRYAGFPDEQEHEQQQSRVVGEDGKYKAGRRIRLSKERQNCPAGSKIYSTPGDGERVFIPAAAKGSGGGGGRDDAKRGWNIYIYMWETVLISTRGG